MIRLFLLQHARAVVLIIAALSAQSATAQSTLPSTATNAERRREYLDAPRRFPFATIPTHATRRQVVTRLRGSMSLGPTRGSLSGGAWQSVGPAPIGTVDAGRVTALAIDPRNPQVIYVGAAQGGVWKTNNGGASWTALTDNQCSLATGSIALDPLNPDIVYVGTGEQNYSGDSYYGCGVLRSTDGGLTWATLGTSIFDTNNGGNRIGRLAIIAGAPPAPSSSTILASSTFGFYRSTDAGQNWTKVSIAANPNSQTTDVVVHPTTPNIVFAAFTSTSFNAANGIYKSTDGGASFPTRLTLGLPTSNVGRIRLAIAPSGPDTMYAAVHNTSNSGLLGIWRSIDAGTSWSQLSATGASCSSQCWYDIHIAVDPTAASVVYFSGFSIYRSTNAGASFTDIGTSIHVDQHAFVFDPVTPTTIIAGNDGGVFRSTNSGASWTALNANLAITQFYAGLSFGLTGGSQLMAGTQDNGTAAGSGTLQWPKVLGGDGGFTAVNPLTGMAFGETQWNVSFGGPRRAATFGTALGAALQNGITMSDAALFIPPLVMDYARPHTLYFGTQRLYRTANNGDLWAPIYPSTGATGLGNVAAIAPAASDSNIVYIGTSSGSLLVTTDGGASWTLRTTGLPVRAITDVIVHRADPQIAFVTVSGFGSGHVFRTADGGVSWTNISGSLPDLPVNAIVLLPDGSLYIGTDLGVYRTGDNGANWEAFGSGLPNVAVFDVAYHAGSSTLAAATHGRSMFTASMPAPIVPTALAIAQRPRGAGSGIVLPQQPIVRVVGPAGDAAPVAVPVTATIASGAGTLQGTTTVTSVNGVATFTNLKIAGSGAYTLRFSAPGVSTITTPSFDLSALRGDVTNDGLITAADADAILRSIVRLPLPAEYRVTPNGDANCDGVINAFDAQVILAYAAGRNVSAFCVGQIIQ